MVDFKKFFAEVVEIDVKHNEKYDLYLYDLKCYHDSKFSNYDDRIKLAIFNKPLDMRIGQRYYIRNVGYNEKFKNLLWVEGSSFMPVQSNDLWAYL
jgi:hypothetical protein